jgi:aspartate carbamoyltransferase catalytic subunit
MMLRIQAERLAGLQLDLEEYKTGYQLTERGWRSLRAEGAGDASGPIIRGLELTGEVADGPQSLILEQVHHGVAIRMALVLRAMTLPASTGVGA